MLRAYIDIETTDLDPDAGELTLVRICLITRDWFAPGPPQQA